MRSAALLTLVLGVPLLFASPAAFGAAASPRGARVNGLKVLSDKIDDVTTVENILKSFVKPGMTDEFRDDWAGCGGKRTEIFRLSVR